MNTNINKVIDNYISRYVLIMKFMYKQTMDVVHEQLGVLEYYSKKKNRPTEYPAAALIKLLYFSAYIGVDGENTMVMRLEIDDQPCKLTFKIKKRKEGAQDEK